MWTFKKFLFESMLLEDKVDFILNKQGDKAWAAYENDKGQGKPDKKDAKGVINTLSGWSEKNLQWLVNSYIKGQFSLEDKGRINDLLGNFEKFKRKLEKKDLNQYKNIDDIEDTLSNFTEEDAKSNKQLAKEQETKYFKDKDAVLFYEGGGIKVIIPKTKETSCHFGIGTKWCTAATSSNNRFDSYSKNGNLYIVITDDGRKYQFYFRSKTQQFMDEKDHSINNWPELIKKYPALMTAFEKIAKKVGFLPLIKDPDDADYLKAVKNDRHQTVKDLEVMKKPLSKEAADYVLSIDGSMISSYPHAFTKEYAIDYFKNEYNNSYSQTAILNGWLTNMVKEVSEKEFKEILDYLISKKRSSVIYGVIKNIFQTTTLEKAYGKWIKDLSLDDKKKLCKMEKDLIEFFEDDLPETMKIKIIDEDPTLLKQFTKATPKMKQAAQWAEDRIKRKSRGF